MSPDEIRKDTSSKPSTNASQSAAPRSVPASPHQSHTAELKPTKKERVMEELRELSINIVYLAGSLCILETYKSLILLQLGQREFVHNYVIAIVEALLLSKIVTLAQKLPLLNKFENQPLVLLILFRSLVMTLLVDLGGAAEDHFFPRSAHLIAQSGNPLALAITHQLACMLIFIVLFAVRGVDRRLGHGVLWNIFFKAPAPANTSVEAA